MPWCPKCRNEYQKGIKECADCGAPLVSKTGKSEPDRDKTVTPLKGGEVFLCSLSGPVEISYITSVLDEEKIPYWMTDSDPGLSMEALMGSSFLGKDIYVGREDLKRAEEIVKSFRAEMLSEDEKEE